MPANLCLTRTDSLSRLLQSNLEVLWLNNNKLVSVTNLDANFRIKELYLHVSGHSSPAPELIGADTS